MPDEDQPDSDDHEWAPPPEPDGPTLPTLPPRSAQPVQPPPPTLPAPPPPASSLPTPPVGSAPASMFAPPAPGSAASTAPPTAPPVEMGVVPSPGEPAGRRPMWPWAVASIVGVVLLVGAGWMAFGALRATSGASSPEAAMDQLLDALAAEDVISLAEVMDPAERRTLVEPMIDDVLPELQRLGVVGDVDLAGFQGIDLEFSGVEYRMTELDPDLFFAEIVAGTATATVDGEQLPLGDLITDRFDDPSELDTVDESTIDEPDGGLALVRRDGRWYVSMWHTVAESLRREDGSAMPAAGEVPAARGSESPDAAVAQFLQSLTDLDIEAMVTSLDPDEAAALYRYWPALADDAADVRAAFDDALGDVDGTIELSDLAFDVERDGDDAVAVLRNFVLDVSVEQVDVQVAWSPDRIQITVAGVVDGESVDATLGIGPRRIELDGSVGDTEARFAVEFDPDERRISLDGVVDGEPLTGRLTLQAVDGCRDYVLVGPDIDESGCLEALIGDSDATEEFVDLLEGVLDALPDEFGGVAFAAHRTDGSWYVSPTMTVMDAVTSGLQRIERSDLEELVDGMLSFAEDPAWGDVLDDGALDGALGDGGLDDGGLDDGGFDVGSIRRVERIEVGVGESATITGELEILEQVAYEIELPEGAVVGTSLYGVDVVPGGIHDPYLIIRSPSGQYVAENDDFDRLNSALQFTATTGGLWSIEVSELTGEPGEYELTIEVVAPGETPSIGGLTTDA